jgi:gliding motility-associated-like protein
MALHFCGVAQENCNNAKDDDDDGLIDLNDPDCFCHFAVTNNLLENGSFESYKNCPENYSYDKDFDIVDYWEYGTYTNVNEANFYHNLSCAYDSEQVMRYIPPSFPLPDGRAFISIRQYVPKKNPVFEKDIAKSYVGQCLQNPLIPGKQYTLSFSAGRFQSSDDHDFKYKTEPFTVAVFGHSDCNAAPFGVTQANSNGCPANFSGWTLLGKTKVYSKGRWVQSKINFEVPRNINLIEIGPDCSILEPDFDLPDSTTYSDFYVYYLDDIHLLPTTDFHFTYIGGEDQVSCSVDSLVVNDVISNASFQWYKDSTAIPGATQKIYYLPQNNRIGNYNVRVTSLDTCLISEPISIGYNLHNLNVPSDTFFCKNDTLLLMPALSNITYTWNGNNTNEIKVIEEGTYNIKAVDGNGCTKTFNVNVDAEDCDKDDVLIPNAFTPNGDGRNDVFRVPPEMKIDLKEFSIFDRLGNKVFTTNDRSVGWDGNFSGEASPPEVYAYLIKCFIHNRPRTFKGSVLLIR